MSSIYKKDSRYRQRLYRDIEGLEDQYKKIVYMKGEKIRIVVFQPICENVPEYVDFEIPEGYPFNPPDVFLRDKKSYVSTIEHIPERTLKELRQIDRTIGLKNPQLCVCGFITKQWVPTTQLYHIIRRMAEIQRVNQKVACLEIMKAKKIPTEVIQKVIAFL